MKVFLYFLNFFLFVSVLYAEDTHSLDETIQQALSHSPEVAIAKANLSYAESKLRSARWGFFHPEIRVSAGDNPINGTNRAGIQISQDLIRFLTLNGDEVRQTNRDLEIARQRLTIAQQQIIHQVIEVMNRLHLAEDLIQVNAEAVAEQSKLLVLAKAQFNTGTVNAEHLLFVQQSLARAEHALRQAEGERWQARIVLSQLIGEPLSTQESVP